ncbi:metallophosphoesterase [soil metagenome]|nr:metallophosphoesterase family protein [Actinomycetota bacterium]
MNILVLADTHIPDFAKALPAAMYGALRRVDLILHAGDVTCVEVLEELSSFAPVQAALGNNDGPSVRAWGAREEVELELNGTVVSMVHDAGPRRGREGRMRRRFPRADLLVFGHSHIPIDSLAEGVRLFNPGSPTWKRRQPAPTYGLITIGPGRVHTQIMELPA